MWLVTGANRGLGLEFVRQLARRGEEVAGTVRPGSDDAALRETGAEVLACDVADDESVAGLARALDGRPVEVLLNNAGRQYRASRLEELDFAELDRVFQVNAFGPFRVTRALLPNLRAGRRKRIVHLTSRMGCFGEYDGASMYGYRASKAALNMLHRCVAEELEREGFVCVALHPGWVRTDMGGAQAPLGAEESVAGMLKVIDRLLPADNGTLLDHRGRRLPW